MHISGHLVEALNRIDFVHYGSYRIVCARNGRKMVRTKAREELVSASNKRRRTFLSEKLDNVRVDLAGSQVAGAEQIHPGVLDGKFVLSPSKVTELQYDLGLDTDGLLKAMISPASALARPPISSFHVGAVGIGESGTLYVGCNLEFANLPLYNSVHAEQFLLVNALHHGEKSIQKLAISAAPCGHCRQFFSELSCADSIKFLFSGGSYSLGQLLPMRFKPADLLDDEEFSPLLLPQSNPIELTTQSQIQIDAWKSQNRHDLVEAAEAALKECQDSYSPYSKCPAGVAIISGDDGEVYSGGYIESAAFNPSLMPLQCAIIDAVIDGMPCYTRMKAAVLVELEEGAVQHQMSMRVMLQQIAPEAEFVVLNCYQKEDA